MTQFSFATAASIRFGVGAVEALADEAGRLGHRPFLVTGSDRTRTDPVTAELAEVGHFALEGEPTFDDATAAVTAARAAGADVVVGIGGGAVLDLAKALAILVGADGDPLDYAEVIGAGHKLPATSLPFVAAPTTAGTGSEVTANAVLSSPVHRVKVSLRSPAMLARVAIVDPALTVSCPPKVTAQSGMDALTQCLEPLTSRMTNPLVEALALAGLRSAARGLVRAHRDGRDLAARTDVAYCSLMGGLSLANAKLGAVHGLAGVLGGTTGAPHGAICAALLAPTTSANIKAMSERDPDNPALAGYLLGAEALTGDLSLSGLLDWLAELAVQLESPGLADLGLRASDHDEVVAKAMRASSMKGNPIDLTEEELHTILEAA
ncbi:iron-containing alcohol dehydrogenase [Tessaracoccus terricola]